MSNIPDVHAQDRAIPPGKVLLADRLPKGETFGAVHVLDTKMRGTAKWKLIAVEAGWAVAGACLRWDNGYFAVRSEIDGVTFGQRYRTFPEALAHFNRLQA